MIFKGKSVIVTGGARGIGRAIVDRFASSGANVSVLDVSIPESATIVGTGSVHYHSGDVTSSGDVAKFVNDVVTRHGSVDILINNAGIIRDNVIWRMAEDDFDSVLKVNLKGPWLCARAVVPTMKEQRRGKSNVVEAGDDGHDGEQAGGPTGRIGVHA